MKHHQFNGLLKREFSAANLLAHVNVEFSRISHLIYSKYTTKDTDTLRRVTDVKTFISIYQVF